MIEFTVFPPSKEEPPPFNGAALQQDEWNDFRYQTLYHLHLSIPEFSGHIGQVKILRRGQTKFDSIQLPVGPLGLLGDEFVSLGQDLDYYERLASLPPEIREAVLSFLRDALHSPDHASTFFAEDGWSTSVLRYLDWETFSRDASVLLERDYDRVARLGLDLTFQVTGWADPLKINFSAPKNPLLWGDAEDVLPDRVAVLVGRNGSGKSTLLSRLARILHASQRDRSSKELRSLATIEPKGIGFTRVLNVAYSAFDAFQLPGLDYNQRLQIAEEVERGTGRYHYVGLRNIASEIRSAQGVGDIDGIPIAAQGPDRQERIVLKQSEKLAEEFGTIISKIAETGRNALFAEACRILATDSSLVDLGPEPASTLAIDPIRLFNEWSTGLKIVMHITASLVAYTESKSIVLIDEPESHLHPPLLAALMHAVRLVLRRNDAFAVVATHSPVVVQETLSRHVAIVRRAGSEIRIHRPIIETYGESIGEITDEIFGLSSDATDFHNSLSALVDSGLQIEAIEGLFDDGLSLQARAFVMTLIAQKKQS